MVAKLAKAIKDRTFAEDLLLAEQESSDDLAQELAIHQEQRWTIEKMWSKKVSRMRRELLVQQ